MNARKISLYTLVLFFIFTFYTLGIPSNVYATNYFVKKTGNDGLAGTDWDTAKQTIGAALLLVDSTDGPDTVHVAAGTYVENLSIDNSSTPNKYDNLSLLGGYPEGGSGDRDPETNETIVDGSGTSDSTVTLDSVSGCTIDGFTITGGSGKSGGGFYRGGGIYCSSSSPTTISNNKIIDNDIESLTNHLGGGIYCDYSEVTTIGNIINKVLQ